MTKVLLTGGLGFIGHHFCEDILRNTDWEIIILDKMSYASSGYDRLRDINAFDDKRVDVFTWDLRNPIVDGLAREIGEVDYILHLAANSHVDNSIIDPIPFVYDNVLGTVNLLNFARTMEGLKRFVMFSTDEVYGSAPDGVTFLEGSPHLPSNSYAASKAASEDFAHAYAVTYKLPIITTNTMNVIGERQHYEKFVPLV